MSFTDVRAEFGTPSTCSLYEAVVLAVKVFCGDPWMERVGPATMLDVEVREPSTKYSLSLQQVERWLDGATSSPLEASKNGEAEEALHQTISDDHRFWAVRFAYGQ